MFYDARYGVSTYAGMFNPLTAEPFPAYYGFVAFNELYKLGNQVALECDTEGLYAVAAASENGKCIVVANPSAEEHALNLTMDGTVKECFLLDETHMYTPVEFSGSIAPASMVCLIIE